MAQNVEGIRVGRYPIDSLQIYFPASLELQEELINNGFCVPRSRDGKVRMPIPIVYSNFRGWVKNPEPITIERLIPLEWLGSNPGKLGWKEVKRGGKRAFIIPQEEVYTEVYVKEDSIIFDLDVKSYHLERASIRGVNPDKWNNWIMFYINLDYIDELISILKNHVKANLRLLDPEREVQQGGKEVTYYVEVPVRNFSVCMGCFNLIQKYLYIKAKEHCKKDPRSIPCKNPTETISKLKLRLEYNPSIRTIAKVGIAKISGKRPQIMVKLASEDEKVIRGVLKEEIRGKARGRLVYCDHKNPRQYIALDLVSFYNALLVTRNYVDKLPKE